jgi:hypothetical protein
VTTLAVTALPPVAGDARTGQFVADAMISCPKTHDLESTADEIRAFFEDDHVHMALIVKTDRRLVTTIERADLSARPPVVTLAAELGTLTGRTAGPAQKLDAVTAGLLREQRRRQAVVDDCGRLLGVLCLKKDGSGYCSDDNIRQRQSGPERPLVR